MDPGPPSAIRKMAELLAVMVTTPPSLHRPAPRAGAKQSRLTPVHTRRDWRHHMSDRARASRPIGT